MDKKRTIGDIINELATRPDIDLFILEMALVKRAYPDRDEYRAVTIDDVLVCDTPGREIEKQQTAELLARADAVLRTGEPYPDDPLPTKYQDRQRGHRWNDKCAACQEYIVGQVILRRNSDNAVIKLHPECAYRPEHLVPNS